MGAQQRRSAGKYGVESIGRTSTAYLTSHAHLPILRPMSSAGLAALEKHYAALRRQFADIGYVSHGSVYRRPAGQSGSRFIWSSKVNNKTVSLALSEPQADWLETAIEEHRKLKKLIADMHRISRQIMRLRFEDTERRKPLNKRVLRLI